MCMYVCVCMYLLGKTESIWDVEILKTNAAAFIIIIVAVVAFVAVVGVGTYVDCIFVTIV